MGRLIVFDQEAASAVRERIGVEPELRRESIRASRFLELAIVKSSIAVMPGEQPGTAIVMRVLRRELPGETAQVLQANPASSGSADRYPDGGNLAPAGFLGLSDSIDMETEPEKPKKWWQKLLD